MAVLRFLLCSFWFNNNHLMRNVALFVILPNHFVQE